MKSVTNEYENAIKSLIKMKGIDYANESNHRAYNNNAISLKLFQAGARVIAKEALSKINP